MTATPVRDDACKAGKCVGSNPLTCAASDDCHVAGTCNPSTGECSNLQKLMEPHATVAHALMGLL